MDFAAQKIHFDVVIRGPRYETWKDLWRALNKRCKKFDFQKEKGENHNEEEHWQCRVTLHKKQTAFAMNTEIIPEIGGLWRLTSNENTDNSRYVTKWPTRIEGPWNHKTNVAREHRLTRDVQGYIDHGPLPWHKEALKYAEEYDERHILLVLDDDGDYAKNVFQRWLEYTERSHRIPSWCDTAKQLIEYVSGLEERRCLTINVPRAMKQEGRALTKLMVAIEAIKDAEIIETRYKADPKDWDRPQIIVFMNDLPDLTMLTKKRWKIMDLKKHYENGFIMKTAFDYDKPLSSQLIEERRFEELASYEKSTKSQKSSFLKEKKRKKNSEKSKVARAK